MLIDIIKSRLLIKHTATFFLLALITICVKAQSSDAKLSQALQKTGEQPATNNQDPASKPSLQEVATENNINDSDDTDNKYSVHRAVIEKNPCDRGQDAYEYEKQWYDDSQIYINTKFCEPVLWFDNFFASDRLFEEGVAGTYIRWRNDFSYDEEDGFNYKMRLNASVVLPGFSDKLRLTFEGDEDEDLRDIAPGGAGADDSPSSLGLQVDVTENVRSKFSASINLSPKLLLRYRYTYPINEEVTMRFTQEVERKKAVNGARTRVDYEHTFKQDLLFRSSSELRSSEEFEGVDWLQAFILYQRLGEKSSIAYETSVNGITEPLSLTTNYRAGVRYRKNFHREWLFYEIAPEITWPITLDDDRSTIEFGRRSRFLIFFRLEVHFGNAHNRRYQDYN